MEALLFVLGIALFLLGICWFAVAYDSILEDAVDDEWRRMKVWRLDPPACDCRNLCKNPNHDRPKWVEEETECGCIKGVQVCDYHMTRRRNE